MYPFQFRIRLEIRDGSQGHISWQTQHDISERLMAESPKRLDLTTPEFW